MKLFFVRHGETDWNVLKKIQGSTNIPLNDLGLIQAECLGKQLLKEDLHIGKVYCSKLLRAKVTADMIAQMLGVPCQILEGIEEMNMGQWEGMTWKEVPEKYVDDYEVWHKNRRYTRIPEGESYQDVIFRVFKALKELVKNHEDNILIVTHSAILMSMQSYLYDTPFYEMAKRYKVRNAGMVTVEGKQIEEIELPEKIE